MLLVSTPYNSVSKIAFKALSGSIDRSELYAVYCFALIHYTFGIIGSGVRKAAAM